MDWSFPRTLYPAALPEAVMWILFLGACIAMVLGSGAALRYAGLKMGLAISALLAATLVIASVIVSMVLAFFLHDL